MNKNYIILDIKIEKGNNNEKIIFINAVKVDRKMNKFDKIELRVSDKDKTNIIKIINFCKDSNIIVYNSKQVLVSLLKILYKNKIYDDFKFKYIDLKNILTDKKIKDKLVNADNIYELIKGYLNKNNISNLDELLFLQPNHGHLFRGLNYPKYLCDIKTKNNKYYGYIVDFSKDKYISYYSCLKELKGEYFNINEINMLKGLGAKIIMNVGYLCEEMLLITNCYSIKAHNCCKINYECSKLLKEYIKYKKQKSLKLILWGNIDALKENYEIVNKRLINKFIKLIDIIKEPWDYWTEKELELIK